MLSAIFTKTQLTTTLKILKTFGALFVVFCPTNFSKLLTHLTVDDRSYHDYCDFANLFNEHFAYNSSSVQLNHLPSGVSYCIPPISENFVRTSLQQLSTGKATGLDELGGYFIKTAASSIS